MADDIEELKRRIAWHEGQPWAKRVTDAEVDAAHAEMKLADAALKQAKADFDKAQEAYENIYAAIVPKVKAKPGRPAVWQEGAPGELLLGLVCAEKVRNPAIGTATAIRKVLRMPAMKKFRGRYSSRARERGLERRFRERLNSTPYAVSRRLGEAADEVERARRVLDAAIADSRITVQRFLDLAERQKSG
jgi:hypothetical protein